MSHAISTVNPRRSFWGLIVAQFFGAFNDNLFKLLVSFWIVQWIVDPRRENFLVQMCGAVFVAPFLLFSMVAGRLADRLGKPQVIVYTKWWELGVIAAAMLSIYLQSIPFMMFTLFLLATQATFFSPAKWGVLPELLEEQDLPWGNAWLNAGTFLGILAGTLAAGYLVSHAWRAKLFLAGASLIGLAAAYLMRPLPPAKPAEPLTLNLVKDLLDNWAIVRQDSLLARGVIAVNYFWFIGAALQLNLVLYASQMLRVTPEKASLLIVALAVGIAVGSFWCQRLSKHHIALRWVTVGAVVMALFSGDLFWAYHSIQRAAFDFFMIGVGGGFYDIPLMALVQARSPAPERGRIMATVNFISFVAILLATVVLAILGSVIGLNPAEVFGAMAVLTAAAAWGVHRYVR